MTKKSVPITTTIPAGKWYATLMLLRACWLRGDTTAHYSPDYELRRSTKRRNPSVKIIYDELRKMSPQEWQQLTQYDWGSHPWEEKHFQILEKTPFSLYYYPSEPYRPIAEFQLQEAECHLKINKTHYYEHAVKVGDRFGYPREIAERIVDYWKKRREFADYQLAEIQR
jgi:hypothetical protein